MKKLRKKETDWHYIKSTTIWNKTDSYATEKSKRKK